MLLLLHQVCRQKLLGLFSEKTNSKIFRRHSKNSRQQDSNLAPTDRLPAPHPHTCQKKEISLNGLQNGRWVCHTVAHTVLNNCSRWEQLWGGGRQNVSQTAAELEEDKCFIIPWGGLQASVQTSKQNHLSDFLSKVTMWSMGLERKLVLGCSMERHLSTVIEMDEFCSVSAALPVTPALIPTQAKAALMASSLQLTSNNLLSCGRWEKSWGFLSHIKY